MQKQPNIQLLAIHLLQPNPFQPRGKADKGELEELAGSIRSHGILEPLVVAHTPAGYQIIAGERRWRASKIAGLAEVPVIIKETNPKGMLEMALIENVQRVNLNAMERAQAFQQLMRDFGFGVAEIAERIGKSVPYISNSIKLLELPDAIKDGLASKQITEGHARAIFGIPDQRSMIEVYKQILKENASVRRAEELARLKKIEIKRNEPQEDQVDGYVARPKLTQVSDEKVEEWQNKFAKFFQARSSIKLARSQTQTRITVTLRGDQDETQQDLEKIMALTSSAVEMTDPEDSQ